MNEYLKQYIELQKQFRETEGDPDSVRALYTFKEKLELSEDKQAKEATSFAVFLHSRNELLEKIMNANRIIVLDDGQVKEQGTHDELTTRCISFRS